MIAHQQEGRPGDHSLGLQQGGPVRLVELGVADHRKVELEAMPAQPLDQGVPQIPDYDADFFDPRDLEPPQYSHDERYAVDRGQRLWIRLAPHEPFAAS